MTYSIFCPSQHFISTAAICPQCGWQRPTAGQIGQPAWGPLELKASLGGPGRSQRARPAINADLAAFPLGNGEIVGLAGQDGRTRWRVALPPGYMTHALLNDNHRLLASISDNRQIGEADKGYLASLHPGTGVLKPVWKAKGHYLTEPVRAAGIYLIRTAVELVALRFSADEEQVQELWSVPLQSWWALPPFVVGQTVVISDGNVMRAEGQLNAYALEDGRLLWKYPSEGLLSDAPAASGERLIFRSGKRRILALDGHNGKKIWERQCSHLYCPPQATPNTVYLCVRGDEDAASRRHYLIQALDAEDGTLQWEQALGQRVCIQPQISKRQLLLGCDNGTILSLDVDNGEVLWQYVLGSNIDPLRSELIVHNELLLAGTAQGHVVALRMTATNEVMANNPQTALAQGDFANAAVGFALQGDLLQAAQLYADRLNEPLKALALYESAQAWQAAGELARQQQRYDQALLNFKKAGNLIAQAETLEQSGDLLGAAQEFEQSGQLSRAAGCYEQTGDLRSALKLYRRCGSNHAADIERLEKQTPPSIDDIDYLVEQNRYHDAAIKAQQLGDLRRAIDLWRKSGDNAQELEILSQYNQQMDTPERWALERQTLLARQHGQYCFEAQAWEKLGNDAKAAHAYENAARQMAQVQPDKETEIANLYAQAAHQYDQAGLEEDHLRCTEQVLRYRKLPKITLHAEINCEFREGENNTLTLVVRNMGWGVAHNVQIEYGSGRFEVDTSASMPVIRHLAPSKERASQIFLRPCQNEIGEVPLTLHWYWEDKDGQRAENSTSLPVHVKRKDEERSSPVIIHTQTYVHGTYVGGDQIGPGAQKGDRVEIQRAPQEQERALYPAPAQQICPNCHLPVSGDSQYCDECGSKLPNDQ